MRIEPAIKRAVSFFDAQNLYHQAKTAFGYNAPNFDPQKLTQKLCEREGWENAGVRLYTGTPSMAQNAHWQKYWTARLRTLKQRGVHAVSLPLRKRGAITIEKGIDVRIALDVVRLARQNKLDVAVIFSQDTDFAEVAKEIRTISVDDDRWIKAVSAYPVSPYSSNKRGIPGTDEMPLDQAFYDSCLDPRNYSKPI